MTGLQQELACFQRRLPVLLTECRGKYVLIRGDQIVDVFESQREAIAAGYERYGPVEFFVSQVVQRPGAPGKESSSSEPAD